MYLMMILVVLAVTLGLGWIALRSPARGPRPRSLTVRIACAVFGVGILAALWIGTARESHRVYRPDPPPPPVGQVQAPTQPPPPMAKDPGPQRYIFTAAVFDRSVGASQTTPVWLDSVALDWPPGRDRSAATKEWTPGDPQLRLTVRLTQTSDHQPSGEFRVERTLLNHGSWSSTGGLDVYSKPGTCAFSTDIDGTVERPKFAVGTARVTGDRKLVLFVNRAAPDDPLRKISWEAFADQYRASLGTVLTTESAQQRPVIFRHEAVLNPPALKLAIEIGFPFLAVMLAAFALSQFFVQRTWAKTGLALGGVLFLVLLDRAAMQTHLERLCDRQAPLRERGIAVANARLTFFHRQAVQKVLDQVAEDTAEPAALRKAILGQNGFDLLEAWNQTPSSRPLNRLVLPVCDETAEWPAIQGTNGVASDATATSDCLRLFYCRGGSLHFNQVLQVLRSATSQTWYSRAISPLLGSATPPWPHLEDPGRWYARSIRARQGEAHVMRFVDGNSAPLLEGEARLPLRFVWFRLTEVKPGSVVIEWRFLGVDDHPIAVAESASDSSDSLEAARCTTSHYDW